MSLGAYCSARIYRWGTGERVDLIAPSRPWVTSVSIRISAGANNTITVALEMSYREAMYWLEQDLFDIGNILEARVGYSDTGEFTPWFSGVINSPAVTLSPNGLTASLTATGVGAAALVNASGKTWDDYTVMEIAEEIARKYSFEIDVSSEAREALSVKTYKPQQASLNDWMFLRQALRDNAHDLWFSSGEGSKATLFIRGWSESLRRTPKRIFALMRQLHLERNQYPIISMTVASAPGAVFNAASTRGIFTQFLDERGELVEVESDPETVNLEDQALGEGSVQSGTETGQLDAESGVRRDIQVDGDDDEAAGSILVAPVEQAAEKIATQLAREAMMGFPGMEISVTTIGIPGLLPYELQELVGASRRFDGLYLTHEVSHDVTSAGYDTTWSGRRNAFTLSIDGRPEYMAVNNAV